MDDAWFDDVLLLLLLLFNAMGLDAGGFALMCGESLDEATLCSLVVDNESIAESILIDNALDFS